MNQVALLILTLSLSLASILVGSESNSQNKTPTEAPTLEQILDKYVEALGGRAALERVNSRASKGTFTSINLKSKGPVEIYAKAPNKWLMVLLAQGYGNYRRGFNGTVAWEKYPGRDSASNLSSFSKRDAQFYLPLKFRETYPNATLKGSEVLNEHETFVIEAPAGLQADDLITAIDGQPAADFTEGHIEQMFTQDGHEFALTIKRGEKLLQARLKLRRLI